MKLIFTLLCLTLFHFITFGQDTKSSAQIIINTGDKGIETILEQDISPIHGFAKKSGDFTGIFDAENKTKIINSDLDYEILIDNLEEFYQNRKHTSTRLRNTPHPCFQNAIAYPVPNNFELGSIAGYFNLIDYSTIIDDMISQYPDIISNKVEIGQSIESRPIHVLRISNNPNIDQSKPQVLYTSIHHSQEPASLSVLLYYMYYLLENYGISEEVTYLIDNTEMYFIPMINPDGYLHNETSNPQGGGTWRKNRRQNSLFSYGVDLNRNYGYMWGFDNIGSQSIGTSPWYRGTEAFSEPESSAVKLFLESKNILIDLNWHAYGNMIIYPWNYENHYTPDSLFYYKISEKMCYRNNYRYGTVAETYGYQCNGDADDWGYGEQNTKNKIISLTAEVGSMGDGFWPSIDRIIPLCNDAIWTNLTVAHSALAFPEFTDLNSAITETSSGYYKFNLKNIGLKENANFTVIFNPLSTNVNFVNNVIISDLSSLESKTDSIAYITTANQGDYIFFEVSIDNGDFIFRDTIEKIFGNITILANDECENMNNWTGNWNITNEHYFSGNYSITDSPNSNYGVFANKALEFIHEIDLSSSVFATLQFMMKYDTEHNHDYVQVFASTDNGSSWQVLCGNNSKHGTDDEDEGNPVYHGMQNEWIMEEVSLNDFIGQTIKVKFHFISDQSNNKDGFYFDNFKVLSIDETSVHNDITNIDDKIFIYPNPANDYLLIENNLEKSLELVITNILGSKIRLFKIDTKQTQIDISDLESGLYFINIHSTNNISLKTLKLIIN